MGRIKSPCGCILHVAAAKILQKIKVTSKKHIYLNKEVLAGKVRKNLHPSLLRNNK